MEGVRVFSPEDWSGSGMDATSYAAGDLKKCLEGLARHLFGMLRVKLTWEMDMNESNSLPNKHKYDFCLICWRKQIYSNCLRK